MAREFSTAAINVVSDSFDVPETLRYLATKLRADSVIGVFVDGKELARFRTDVAGNGSGSLSVPLAKKLVLESFGSMSQKIRNADSRQKIGDSRTIVGSEVTIEDGTQHSLNLRYV